MDQSGQLINQSITLIASNIYQSINKMASVSGSQILSAIMTIYIISDSGSGGHGYRGRGYRVRYRWGNKGIY